MRFLRAALVLVAGVGVALQLLPGGAARDNPPATATLAGPPEVVSILRRACFDCHSNETRWPFYAYVAPASWLVTNDVAGARSRLNFSAWEDLREGFRKRFSRKIVERVEAGEMPLWQYRLVHRRAAVTPTELDVLRAWRDRLNAPATQD